MHVLDKAPAYFRKDYDAWLTALGLPPSPAAELAFTIVTVSGVPGTQYDAESLYRLEAVLRKFLLELHLWADMLPELRAWRFPTLNLDLVQLAIVCKGKAAPALLSEGLFNEDHYVGPSGPVNHPLHLACRFSDPDSLSAVLRLQPEDRMPETEGTITVALMGNRTTSALVGTLAPGKELQGSLGQFATLSKECLMHLYKHYYLKLALASPGVVSGSSIECLWDFLHRLCCCVSTWQTHLHLLRLVRSSPASAEFALPFYQLVCAVRWNATRDCSFRCLKLLHVLSDSQSSALLGYMRRDQLRILERVLEKCEMSSSTKYPYLRRPRMRELLAMVREKLQGRTLQRECVLTILRALGGVSVKARHLALPGGLRSGFCVPFLELYEEICPPDRPV